MLKVIIGLLIAGVVLYVIFGIWGVVIPTVLFVGVVVAGIINANKNPTPVTPTDNGNTSNSTTDIKTENPPSNTPIDLSALDKIYEKIEKRDIDFWLLTDSNYERIREKFDNGNPLTAAMIERNNPVKIAYTDNNGNKTTRDIIPYRMNGYISDEDGEKTYDFFIEAFCLLRNEERSFHTNGILAAWFQGQEINLGDYLAELCKKSKDYKEAIKSA